MGRPRIYNSAETTDFMKLEAPYYNAIETTEVTFENEKVIAKAAAEAEAKLKAAQAEIEIAKAEAEAKKIAAEGQAQANNIVKESLTDKIIQEKYIEKWDGKLPSVMTGDDGSILISPTE